MTSQEKNVLIAEACGLSVEVAPTGGYYVVIHRNSERPDGYIKGSHHISISGAINELPNYCGDLNACHEMEKALRKSPLDWGQYCNVLAMICGGVKEDDGGMFVDHKSAIDATAEQRADAFIATLNLKP